MAAKIEPQLILEAAILIRRATCPTAMPLMTAGIAALGPEAVARIVKTIAVYDDFCHANDAYEEHDFGSFEADGQLIFFKIDYFDKALNAHSPDPSDPSVSHRARHHHYVGRRVLTVSVPSAGTKMRRALTTPELHRAKPIRDEFLTRALMPITVLQGRSSDFGRSSPSRWCC